ncbi:PEP-CTERM sorting domain-containing protein [Romeria aff. gracilis LEGE 07310]|uniref:PEP-CTERM sorting domain-containing protein n=1 Tax=Vasconcelosia minhoensis LEGE 07310 TaxID=915328 RepID=A0A8J7ARH7_9CYAN|nr:PEP-CTERM sorting domain-containing protein [Romeria gracilis]MBE9079156.1 PEP-CTERM sorting domain-containing protein [Romeria aff. gracilis LEGE 07310]
MAAPVVLSTAPAASAAILWNESTDGDLSDVGLNPTQLSPLVSGSNFLKATFNAGAADPSPDYFTVEVPKGLALSAVELLSWKAEPSFEDIAFMAVQKGSVFDFVVPADRSNANGLLGWSHLRSTQVGTNKVLVEMSVSDSAPSQNGVDDFYAEEADSYPDDLLAADPELPARLLALGDQWVPGAEGFEIPLGAGTYTFWLRQGSDTNITTEFDFKTVAVSTPEPMTGLAMGLALGTGLLAFGKQRKRTT